MSLFGKNRRQANELEENFSDYVDSLLDSQESAGIQEQALRPSYSIDQAIALMRKMPNDNQALIVGVIRDTLQSANIDVSAIIQDADEKSTGLSQEVSDLKAKITALREEIKDMEAQIQQADKDLSETTKVRVLLEAGIVDRNKRETKKHIETTAKSAVVNSEPSSEVDLVSEVAQIEDPAHDKIVDKLAS